MKKALPILLAALLLAAITILTAFGGGSAVKGEEKGVPTPQKAEETAPDAVPLADVTITETPEEPAGIEPSEGLYRLGLMKGVGTLESGEPDFALDQTLTRQEALTLIVRVLGHGREAEAIGYAHPFTDVAPWASGAVGYAYQMNIAQGVSPDTFNAKGLVTGRELVTFILRALGFGKSFNWETACTASDGLGITHGQFGGGTEPITRGDAAEVFYNVLSFRHKGSVKSLAQNLVETGVITRALAEEARLADALSETAPGTLTADEAMEKYAQNLFTLTVYGRDGEEIGTACGFFTGESTGVTAFSALQGCTALTVTDKNGSTYEITGITGIDEKGDLAALTFDGAAPGFFSDAAAAPEKDTTVYLLSAAAASGVWREEGIDAPITAGLPVIDCFGRYLGVLTAGSRIPIPSAPVGTPVTVTALAEARWPEVFKPEYPRGIDPTKPMVCLTYDDGPSATVTPQLLDLMEEYGVVATFFEVGSRLKSTPQFLTRMEELGCEIGNHSYSHANLNNLSASKIADEIEKTNVIIRREVGHDATLVRPPYGNANATVKSAVPFPLINWSVDTLDWKSRNADKVFDAVTGISNLDGKIILMHSLYSSTLEATKRLIPWLMEQGYQLVTVSELAEYRGVELKNGTVYNSFYAK